jgi:hypothetical protein
MVNHRDESDPTGATNPLDGSVARSARFCDGRRDDRSERLTASVDPDQPRLRLQDQQEHLNRATREIVQ